MQSYVQEPGIETHMQSVLKSKSKNELFRLYACIVKIMLAVSELDGKHMNKARARLSKATGELCAFYLVACVWPDDVDDVAEFFSVGVTSLSFTRIVGAGTGGYDLSRAVFNAFAY
jgi:hypothetical protein